VNVDLVTATGHAPAPFHPAMVADQVAFELRSAQADEAGQIHALIQEHLEEGHLLPRGLDELTVRAGRFVVAVAGDRVVACAELAPLSGRVAEVRSLVVHDDARHEGLGQQLVHELMRRARLDGFDTLCAFTHGTGFFVRLGFSIVPHHWVREKILVDCQGCPLFRRCGQHAVVLSLRDRRQPARP
jgi:N-acetylglutamate synthase-like GNAT family acetyltransferase